MVKPLFFALVGYLFGSILFANVFSAVFRADGMLEKSKDQNPGTANAFQYGGFWCGVCTLCGDVMKGVIPIQLLMLCVPISEMDWRYVLALAAPVIGHVFPIFTGFRGGKGIAVTFGCLLGLFPHVLPFFLFVAIFIFLSVVLQVTPHFYRTICAYVCTALLLFVLKVKLCICAGFLVIAAVVCFRMHISKEEREKMRVSLRWMH